MALRLATKRRGTDVLIEVRGALVLGEAAFLREQLQHVIDETVETLMLDGRTVSEIDSSGLSLLLALHRLQQSRHGAFVLIADSPQINRALEVTRLDDVIDVRRQLPDGWSDDEPPPSGRFPRRNRAEARPEESG